MQVSALKKKRLKSLSHSVTPLPDTPSGAELGASHYPSLGHHKAQELARIDSERTFQRVEFHVVPSQQFKGFL